MINDLGCLDQETFDIIQKIAKEHSFKTFGYLTKQDLEGEIWQICLEQISEYTDDRGKLEHFLRVTVKNRLINSFKKITKSVKSPCPRCEFYDPGNSPSDCGKFGHERMKCSKWRNYMLSIESRNSLLNPTDHIEDRANEHNFIDKIVGSELIDIVKEKLSKDFRKDLEDLLNGKSIVGYKLEELRKEIVRIMYEYDPSMFDTKQDLTIKETDG